MGDGLHQVGLAQPGGAVDEKRVVGLAWCFDHSMGCCGGKLIRFADDKAVEGIAIVERLRAGIRLDGGLSRSPSRRNPSGGALPVFLTRKTMAVGRPTNGSASRERRPC